MGLCRCPQRKVSTLFCFKHHVNVCESCLVTEHPQCIVRSYVSWLQDNDYNPNCSLCQRSLTETSEETIRLICYDLFHWSCLDEYFRSFPSHTAPDGYTCPICNTCIFPPSNLVSPVADHIRRKLATVNWATHLPISSLDEPTIHQDKQQSLIETEKNGYVIVNPTGNGNSTGGETNRLSHLPHRAIDLTQGSTTKVGLFKSYCIQNQYIEQILCDALRRVPVLALESQFNYSLDCSKNRKRKNTPPFGYLAV